MKVRSIAAALAIVAAFLTLAWSTDCGAGGELVFGAALAGALAAVWNDNPERSIADRIAKFVMIVFMAGLAVLFSAFLVNANRCS